MYYQFNVGMHDNIRSISESVDNSFKYKYRPNMKNYAENMKKCLADKMNELTHICSGCASD